MQVDKVQIMVRGKTVKVDSMPVGNKKIIVTGKFIKTAKIEDEWFEDVGNPASIIENLKKGSLKTDFFTFFQRIPETKPKYNYYMEWESVANIHIKSYDHWWKKQINAKTRNMIRKAEKKGVVVKETHFNDEFVSGMTKIFNETPFRQGIPFWHYGKDFHTVKKEFSRYLHREDLIGAYYNGELIGFVMLSYAGKFAVLGQIISMIKHRDKAPNNALIAKAVKICDEKKIPYLNYAMWGKGPLFDFKRYNGFEKMDLPRYFIPLNIKGMIILKLKLHHGISRLLPEKLLVCLKGLRNKWYTSTRNTVKGTLKIVKSIDKVLAKGEKIFLRTSLGLALFKLKNRKKERFTCPICKYIGPFADVHPETGIRRHARCPRCGLLERTRLQYLVVEKIAQKLDFSKKSILHFAPEPFFKEYLRRIFKSYTSADLTMKNVDYQADLLNLPFEDESYDVVFASHVLEHIKEDAKALSEIRRILKPKGIAIIQVPIVAIKTVEYPEANPYDFSHFRANGLDYYDKYSLYFSKVEKYDSNSFPENYQLFTYEDRTKWPKTIPLRPTTEGEKHLDILPVCYKNV